MWIDTSTLSNLYERKVHATNLKLWGWVCTGGKSPGRSGYSVRDTCSCCREATSTWKREKGKPVCILKMARWMTSSQICER